MALTPITLEQANAGLQSGSFWTGTTLTYSIPGAGASWAGGGLPYGAGDEPFDAAYSTLNATQTTNFINAVEVWDDLVGLSLNLVNDAQQQGDIRIAFSNISIASPGAWAYAYLPPGGGGNITGQFGDIWVDDGNKGDDFTIGTFGFFAILHELGHSLGFKHTFEAPVIAAPFDNSIYSVMSYTWSENRYVFTANGSRTETVYNATPMVVDIMAAQSRYGADAQTAAGATVHAFTDADTAVRRTIYDAGGVDTIDLSALSRGSLLDMRPGAYSNLAEFSRAQQVDAAVAQFGEGNRAFYTNVLADADTYTWTNNLGIAFSTTIENAIGSNFADTIIGNDAVNTIAGGGGADTVTGGGGIDVYRGTAAQLAGDTITDIAAGETIVVTNPGAVIVNAVRAGNVLTVTYTATATGAAQQTFTMNLTGATLAVAFAGNTITYGGAAPPPPATDDLFFGVPGPNTFDGGAGNDTVSYVNATTGVRVDLGVTAAQTVSAQQGADTLISIENLIGSRFNDLLFGNGQNNRIDGAAGDDTLVGGLGNDILIGGEGFDTADYSDATAAVTVNLALTAAQNTGAAGSDTLTGIEQVVGSGFNDTLTAAAAGSQLNGGAGVDTLNGGAGDDSLIGGAGNDALNGGGGSDTAEYVGAASVTVSLLVAGPQDTGGAGTDTLVSIENIVTDGGADRLTGNDQRNLLFAGGNADVLDGRGGDDSLFGGAGDDLLIGGAGDDALNGEDGSDTASYAGAAGPVTVSLAIADAQNTGGAGTDTLDGVENLIGSDGADTLTGDGNINRINGGLGADTVTGGGGLDVYVGTAAELAGDTINEFAIGETIVLTDPGATIVSAVRNGNVLTVTYTATPTPPAGAAAAAGQQSFTINVTGPALGFTVAGGTIVATAAPPPATDDLFLGVPGANVFDGGLGNDTVSYVNATTTGVVVDLNQTTAQAVSAQQGPDTLISIENLVGSGLNDTLTGNALANRLDGGAGNDVLVAGAGNDTLLGGAGDDTLNGGQGTDTADYTGAAGVAVSLAVDAPQNTGGAGTDTLISIENLIGSAGDDTLTGDERANRIEGRGGNDTLAGGLGSDTLDGGEGVDTADYSGASPVVVSLAAAGPQNTGANGMDMLVSIENLTGSSGDDQLTGDGGANRLAGGQGNDTLVGDAGADTLLGGLGNDVLNGGQGVDTADYSGMAAVTVSLALAGAQNTGGAGADTLISIENLVGSSGNDTLTGNGGANRLAGGAGDDTLTGGLGADTLDGGEGVDTADYSGAGPVIVNLSLAGPQNTGAPGMDTLISIENLIGSSGNDTLTGNGGANRLAGGDGVDTLNGGLGIDTLVGGAGLDVFRGLAAELDGDTIVDIAAGERIVLDDAGAVVTGATRNGSALTVTYTTPATGATVNSFTMTLAGSTLAFGFAGSTITALPPPPPPPPPATDDLFLGVPGPNVFDGGLGNDTVSYVNATTGVTVDLGLATAQAVSAQQGPDTLISIENLVGSRFDDRLTGNAVNNRLDGGDGADTLAGGAGDDALIGGKGWDTADYSAATGPVTVNLATAGPQNTVSAGIDTLSGIEALIGSAFGDILTGDAFSNNIFGGGGNDVITGAGSDDNLDGQGGDDTIDGGAGRDTMWGGAGNDTYIVDDWNDIAFEGFGGGSTADSGGVDLVRASSNYKLGQFVENLTLTGTAKLEGYGNGLDNRIEGNGANNWIVGNGGNDTLIGGGGDDRIEGSDGRDLMTGGEGRDRFVIKFMSDAKVGAERDRITDFKPGEDVIDLGGLDANTHRWGDQGFSFITTGFTGHAGQLRAAAGNGVTIVEGDVNGDGHADFQIQLDQALTLTAQDFVL